MLPAVLTVLSRLHIDLAGALSSADVLRCSLVLQGSSEECSAAEAGDGPVVNMSSSPLAANLNILFLSRFDVNIFNQSKLNFWKS